MQYPVSRREKHISYLSGVKIIDYYKWLEDGNSKKVVEWTNKQNSLTESYILKNLKEYFSKNIQKHYHSGRYSTPIIYGKKIIWSELKVNQNQDVLYISEGNKKKVLIDPNKLGKEYNKIFTLDYYFLSPNANYLAYGMSEGGSEKSVLKIMDVKTQKDIEVISTNSPWASIEWTKDEKAIYYTKYPDEGTVSKANERFYQKVYFHNIGDNPKSDKLIFGKNRPKKEMYYLNLSDDSNLLSINVSQNWTSSDIYLYDIKLGKIKELIVGINDQFYLYFKNNYTFLFTSYKTLNNQILRIKTANLTSDLKKWEKFIPESKDKLEFINFTSNKIICTYLVNASKKSKIFNLDGEFESWLPIPENASLNSLSTRSEEKDYFYSYVSFTTPGVIIKYTDNDYKFNEYKRHKTLINEQDYVVEQKWFKSKDGTKVPMFIIYKKGIKLNAKNPAILYGYGGFEYSITPWFIRMYYPWIDNGGILAVANIRGGGEFGRKWHLDAIKFKKQNSFDDFIAAAEKLIKDKYTDERHLGIYGGSNGGLLVSAVSVQRPELFNAVVSEVPLIDLVNYSQKLIGELWTDEYGDPENKKELINLIKISPYHNLNQTKEYPSFLFTTALNDSRVDPMHARKMAALLQHINKTNPVLLFTDSKTGHTGSLTMKNFYTNYGLIFAFFAKTLQMSIPEIK